MSEDMIRSVAIVGGGTAGWMAAAALKRSLGPHAVITLVESAEIGIIGVGEATIPAIRQFNEMIGLPEAPFMKATQATFKLGIEFVNWGKVGGRYFHPFGAFGPAAELGNFHQIYLRLKAAGADIGELADYSMLTRAAHLGRMAATSRDPRSPLLNFHSAYHFDAVLYARHLRGFCEQLGVQRVEGEVVDVRLRPTDGFVDSLKLKDGREITADLYIDCTGFRGLLIEGALKAGYEDWSHWLPVNRAVAAPCAKVGPVAPYTTSTAQDAGWIWRIPLQHRTGNGYVYCSDHISDDEAAAKLVAQLDGKLLAEPRFLRFVTGRRKTYWDRNVVALGLASGFIEPLESTSIHMSHAAINRLIAHFPDRNFAPANIAAYNARVGEEVTKIRDFVILHYHATQRDDTPFWRHVKSMPIPDELAERVEVFRERGLLMSPPHETFSHSSWLAVLMGQNITPRSYNRLFDYSSAAARASELVQLRQNIAGLVDTLPIHDDFLAQNGLKAGADPVAGGA